MEVILTANVEKVGRKGDVVRVRDGFGRNFLLARRLAVPATRANQEFVEEQRERSRKRQDKERAEATALSEKVSQVKLTLDAPAGEGDKLYGSVTAEDVCEALNRKGYQFDRRQVVLKEPIRSLGSHAVTVELYPQVKATITVDVVRKS